MIENQAYENRSELPESECIIHKVKNHTFTRYGKYRVELELYGQKAKVCWLSIKQMQQLEWLFSMTPNGYSCKRICIVGVFNEDGYYRYAKYCKSKNVFHEPYQFDLEGLRDD